MLFQQVYSLGTVSFGLFGRVFWATNTWTGFTMSRFQRHLYSTF